MLEAKAIGATGTLTLFINGRRGNGVPPPTALLNTLVRNLLAGGDGSGPGAVDAVRPRPDRRARSAAPPTRR